MAIDPQAIGNSFASLGGQAFVTQTKQVAVLRIEGPLSRRSSWYGDGYSDIAESFEEALSDPTVGAVILRIDSPGGGCSGCFETVREMRAMAEASGKPVLAYADETACSAAYALACVADEIWLPASGCIGSVGVIQTLEDFSKMNDRIGLRVEVVASGEEKADGHPDVPLTDDVIARFRAEVDTLAGQFAELVGERRKMSAADVLAKEAAVYLGESAVAAGLADRVGSFTQALAAASARIGTSAAGLARAEGNAPMKTLFAKLGLAETATEAEAIAAVVPLLSVQNELAALTAKGSHGEQLAVVQAWRAGNEQLPIVTARAEKAEADLKALAVTAQAAELAATIEAGRAAGKLTKVQADGWAKTQTAESLRAFLEHAPVVLQRDPAVAPPPEASTATSGASVATGPLTPEEKSVAKQLGLSAEQMIKGRKAPKEVV